MSSYPFFLLLLLTILATMTVVVLTSPAKFGTTAPFAGQKYADITSPRGLLVDDAGDILVVSKTPSIIIALFETPLNDTVTVVNQAVIVNGSGLGLNHGIAYLSNYLYASSQSTVYRWPYTPGQRVQVTVEPETVIHDIPSGGAHVTRTLIFDSEGRLYVTVGAAQNVDPDSERSRIRRFDQLTQLPVHGFNFSDGEIFADGLRNEVALDFDLNGILYGLENGVGTNLSRPDLGDILGGNPSEEMNRFDSPILGTHYGYPYCFSSYNLDGYDIGTQFAMPNFWIDGIHSDEWCRNPENNRRPIFHLPAHAAPLGLQFYKGEACQERTGGAFPCSHVGDAIAALHGSNYVKLGAETGYAVTLYPMDKLTMTPTGDQVNIIFAPNITHCDGTCFRPVNAVFNKNGHLIVSADKSNEIFRVVYNISLPKILYSSYIQS